MNTRTHTNIRIDTQMGKCKCTRSRARDSSARAPERAFTSAPWSTNCWTTSRFPASVVRVQRAACGVRVSCVRVPTCLSQLAGHGVPVRARSPSLHGVACECCPHTCSHGVACECVRACPSLPGAACEWCTCLAKLAGHGMRVRTSPAQLAGCGVRVRVLCAGALTCAACIRQLQRPQGRALIKCGEARRKSATVSKS